MGAKVKTSHPHPQTTSSHHKTEKSRTRTRRGRRRGVRKEGTNIKDAPFEVGRNKTAREKTRMSKKPLSVRLKLVK